MGIISLKLLESHPHHNSGGFQDLLNFSIFLHISPSNISLFMPFSCCGLGYLGIQILNDPDKKILYDTGGMEARGSFLFFSR